MDAAQGVTLKPGEPGGGAPALQNLSYQGDTNLGDPIVAPFVTKTAARPVSQAGGRAGRHGDHHPGHRQQLWGNVYGAAHGGVCSASASSWMTEPPRLLPRRPGVPAAEAAGIYKRFGSTQALRGVDLDPAARPAAWAWSAATARASPRSSPS